MSFSRPNCAIPCDVRIPSATRVLETQNLLQSSQVVPPKREAFHKRGGFCTGPSECLNRLVSSETMDGLRLRLARILEPRNVLQTSQVLNRQWTRIHAKD